jgi:alkanesulfonate monooxygenase SsuD/methylene tetrahydromethanopterin reductase-like flavin-dependent oxidoreductase (luciferase family)
VALPLRGPRAGGPPILLGTYPTPGPRMRRLAARYADGWNGWLAFDTSSPEAARSARAGLGEDCRVIGRDPETLWRSVAVGVALAGRRLTFGPWDIGAGAMSGSTEELAEMLRAFAREGISHVQVYLGPTTAADIETFASVLALLDAGGPHPFPERRRSQLLIGRAGAPQHERRSVWLTVCFRP